jgi:hypothetical protein
MGVTLPNFATNRVRKRSKGLRLVALNFVENSRPICWSYSCYGCYLTQNPKTEEGKGVAYSVMVWLVDPGEQAHQAEAVQRTTTGRSQAPGAASGVNEPPAFTRMVYGVYERLDEAKKALSEISNKLRENEPLEITSGVEHANRISLIPAHRVHYVVCDDVERPRDRSS